MYRFCLVSNKVFAYVEYGVQPPSPTVPVFFYQIRGFSQGKYCENFEDRVHIKPFEDRLSFLKIRS